ncbi:MAG TPA: DnaJ domain-containing protein [Candidatus Acidoferrales bacterium]
MRELTPAFPTSGPKRRSTRIIHSAPLLVTWIDQRKRNCAENTVTLSINCHGFRFFSRQRPSKNTAITFQLNTNAEEINSTAQAYRGRVARVQRSQRFEGQYLVAVESGIPLNIWNVEDAPEDWAAFSLPAKEDPSTFLAEVDRILLQSGTATHYQMLGVHSSTPPAEVKRHFYRLASRFHPDHHMDHPEWTPRLLAVMENLLKAYRTLSDDDTKKEYDSILSRVVDASPSDSRRLAQTFLEKAEKCAAEKNVAGCILWLHRAIESEPKCSTYREMLGRCLAAVPEYRGEAVEQFEMAIQLEPSNLNAHLHFGELLEQLKVPWRARIHYLRALEIDMNHCEARRRLNLLEASTPRRSPKPSLLGRLTGRQ